MVITLAWLCRKSLHRLDKDQRQQSLTSQQKSTLRYYRRRCTSEETKFASILLIPMHHEPMKHAKSLQTFHHDANNKDSCRESIERNNVIQHVCVAFLHMTEEEEIRNYAVGTRRSTLCLFNGKLSPPYSFLIHCLSEAIIDHGCMMC